MSKMMKVFVFAAMFMLLSCQVQEAPVHYLTQHWKPGTEQRYSLITADSGFVHIDGSMDEDSLDISKVMAYEVALTILDTADGPMVEWMQFVPRVKPTSKDTVYDQLLYKVRYRCDRLGRFSEILNADEMKVLNDSLVWAVLGTTRLDSAQLRSIIASSNAQSLAEQFIPSLERFHGLYGAQVLTSDTMFGMAQDLDSAMAHSRFNYVLPDVGQHCSSGSVALRSWATSSDTMDLMQEVLMLPLPLAVKDQSWGSMQNEIELCLDTVTWFPQRYLFRRTSQAGGTKVVSTTTMKRL